MPPRPICRRRVLVAQRAENPGDCQNRLGADILFKALKEFLSDLRVFSQDLLRMEHLAPIQLVDVEGEKLFELFIRIFSGSSEAPLFQLLGIGFPSMVEGEQFFEGLPIATPGLLDQLLLSSFVDHDDLHFTLISL